MQVIGGALLASLGTYAFVVAQIQRTHAPFAGFAPGVPHDPLRLVFAALVKGLCGPKRHIVIRFLGPLANAQSAMR